MTKAAAVPTLYRYWVWANLMRICFERELSTESTDFGSPAYLASKSFIFMSYWYGGLYVVVEGWQELGLEDATVDKLLESRNVGLLKRFRHGAFHFQRKWLDERLSDFMGSTDGVAWVRNLTKALGGYLRAEVKRRVKTSRA